MTCEELFQTLLSMDCRLAIDGDELVVRTRCGVLTGELRDLIRLHRDQLIRLLYVRESNWPPECLESERRFGHPSARLYPLLGKPVRTPHGTGELFLAFSGQAGVVLRRLSPGEKKVEPVIIYCNPLEVLPA